MKGLIKIPNQKEMIKIYNTLHKEELSEDLFSKYFQQSRFDPRLAEIFTEKLALEWRALSPVNLNFMIRDLPWAAVMGVLVGNVKLITKKNDFEDFCAWSKCVLHRIQKAYGEIFFIDTYRFAGKLGLLQVLNANKIFVKWGYFSDAILVNKSALRVSAKTLLRPHQRRSIIENLAKENFFFH